MIESQKKKGEMTGQIFFSCTSTVSYFVLLFNCAPQAVPTNMQTPVRLWAFKKEKKKANEWDGRETGKEKERVSIALRFFFFYKRPSYGEGGQSKDGPKKKIPMKPPFGVPFLLYMLYDLTHNGGGSDGRNSQELTRRPLSPRVRLLLFIPKTKNVCWCWPAKMPARARAF